MSQENISANASSTEETISQDQVFEATATSEIETVISHVINEEVSQQDPHPSDHPAPTTKSLADFEQFLEALKAIQEPERKLDFAIQFMQERLAQAGVPHFKEFWDARRLCLDLFKENINATSRVNLWARYSELCREARKLKEIFDEQSAFAAEQIEIAVAALEAELADFDTLLASVPDVDFGPVCHSLQDHMAEYNAMQRELNLLNNYAMRTSQLRKELIKTEMRIRAKNKFFERLSKLGDAIFPRRKALIQKVSEQFTKDVERFIKTTFVSELKTPALFSARDEIKALQSVAKILTLNTEAFSSTRKTLSECWDSIKNIVKERRKVVSEQKSTFKKHRDEFVAEIEALKAAELTASALEAKIDDLVGRMRAVSLGKLEIRELRDMVRELRQQLSAKTQNEDAQRREVASKKDQEKRARHEALKNELISLSKNTALDIQSIEKALEPLAKEVSSLSLSRIEKQEFEKLVRNVRDFMAERKEAELLALSADDREAIAKIKDLLKERKATRQEIKQQIETWRKESGSSGMDFARAIEYNDLIQNEKERLEKVESGIEELESTIKKLQGQKG